MATNTERFGFTLPSGQDPASIIPLNLNTQNIEKYLGMTQDMLAPLYNETEGTYEVDDIVTHDSILYKCIEAVETPEAFDETKWVQTTAVSEGGGGAGAIEKTQAEYNELTPAQKTNGAIYMVRPNEDTIVELTEPQTDDTRVTASSYGYDSNFQQYHRPWCAFNRVSPTTWSYPTPGVTNETAWVPNIGTDGSNSWIRYEFDKAENMTSMKILAFADYSSGTTKSMIIEGSNDGETWDNILADGSSFTLTASLHENYENEVDLDPTNAYKYVRLRSLEPMGASYQPSVFIDEIYVYGYGTTNDAHKIYYMGTEYANTNGGSGGGTSEGEGVEIYSEDEYIVGKWIDGKNVYQRTYTGLSVQTSGTSWVHISAIDTSTWNEVIDCEIYRTLHGKYAKIPLAEVSTNVDGITTLAVSLVSSTFDSVITALTVRYTKTVETPAPAWGGSVTNNYANFIDTDNVIQAETQVSSGTTGTYTATEDCYIRVKLWRSSTGASSLSIDGVEVLTNYSDSGTTALYNTIPLKKGQTATIDAGAGSPCSYTVYGITYASGGSETPATDASEVEYDNTTSQLTADNVQDAIDEVVANVGTASEDILTLQNVQGYDEYDETQTYAVGDYAIYNNIVYECTTAVSTAEPFDSTKWTATSIEKIIDGVKGDISQLNSSLTPEEFTVTAKESITITKQRCYKIGKLAVLKITAKATQDITSAKVIIKFPSGMRALQTDTVFISGQGAEWGISNFQYTYLVTNGIITVNLPANTFIHIDTTFVIE